MSRTLTRADLTEAVYRNIGLSRNESADLVRLLEEMCVCLEAGEEVKLSSFGTLSVQSAREGVGRNPKPVLKQRSLRAASCLFALTSEKPSRSIVMTAKAEGAFRTISEVSKMLEVPAHVLRFWESKFKSLSPLNVMVGGGTIALMMLICSYAFGTSSIVMANHQGRAETAHLW